MVSTKIRGQGSGPRGQGIGTSLLYFRLLPLASRLFRYTKNKFLSSINSDSDDVWITSGVDQEIVLEAIFIEIILQIDVVIDIFINDAGIVGYVCAPLRGIVAVEEVGFVGELLETDWSDAIAI